MAFQVPMALNDVFEITLSYVALDQLIQYKFDVIMGGVGSPISSDDFRAQLEADWGVFLVLIGTSTKHAQTRIQKITDCVLGTTGKPKRVRGGLDKEGPVTAMNGTAASPFLPMINTVSIQLITAGSPKQFWGRKGFGQLPLTTVQADGSKMATLVRASWDSAATSFFATIHAIAGTTMNFKCGILPTTYVANQALPHGAMSGYFWTIDAVEVGYYLGSQITRDIEPQATLGH